MKEKTVEEIFAALREPFPPQDIQWRIGQKSKDGKKAMVLPYVTNRAIMERLDQVVGVGNWYPEFRPVDAGGEHGMICRLSILLDHPDGMGKYALTREDGASNTKIEPIKGGISDSMKRAAVQFGIGRYLYNLSESWVPLGDYNRFEPPRLPLWALPKGFAGQQTQVQSNSTPLHNSNEEPQQDDTPRFTKGKYANKAISEINDINYLRWVVEQSSFDEDTKKHSQKRLGELNG